MKLLLLNKDSITGASWVGDYYPTDIASNGKCFSADEFHKGILTYSLLNLVGGRIYVNSGSKIRFQKSHQNLNLPKGLNEF